VVELLEATLQMPPPMQEPKGNEGRLANSNRPVNQGKP